MPSSPLVSIIIPAYNGQQRIARAVNSIVQQNYTKWEAIIISDDEQDYDKVLSDKGIRSDNITFYTTGKTGAGAGVARNIGLSHANGDIIAFLDCDDTYDSSYLSAMLPLAEKYGAAFSQIRMIDDANGTPIALASHHADSEMLLPHEVTTRSMHTYIPVMVNRSKINHSFAPLERMADYVFLMQMFNTMDCIGFSAAPSYRYYKHLGSSTQFAKDADVVAQKFIAVFEMIKQSVETGDVQINNPAIKHIIMDDMDMLIAAEHYFVEAARSNPDIQFYEILPAFMKKWRLTATRRSAN